MKTPDDPIQSGERRSLQRSWAVPWLATTFGLLGASLVLSWVSSRYPIANYPACGQTGTGRALSDWAAYALFAGGLLAVAGLALASGWRILFLLAVIVGLFAFGASLHVEFYPPSNCGD